MFTLQTSDSGGSAIGDNGSGGQGHDGAIGQSSGIEDGRFAPSGDKQ